MSAWRVDPRVRLALASFLMLFVELALIRWMGSRIVWLSFFSNFVLLGSFLGIGLGFLRHREDRPTFHHAPFALAALVVFASIFDVTIERGSNGMFFAGVGGLPIWVVLPAVFAAVAATLMFIADGVAAEFGKFEPLIAYRLDIVGAIAGIVAFSALSFLRAPPLAWGVIVALVLAFLLPDTARWLTTALLVVLVVTLGIETFTSGARWSPYYRVDTSPFLGNEDIVDVRVNGIPHQVIIDKDTRLQAEPVYGLPYELGKSDPSNMLIIGAGNGSDVAIALDQGAEHVDAVEIDPVIHGLGVELNPNHPYDDERVSSHIDDGRAFLERTDSSYDMVLFALPDSLTVVSAQSALRLESYLFTKEAFESVRDHLTDDGVFAMYNLYRREWLVDRLANTLDEVFGHPPCVRTVNEGDQLAMLVIARDPDLLDCGEDAWVRPAGTPEPTTDDYPFPYVRERGIPSFYLIALGLILAGSALAVRASGGGFRTMGRYLDLFFMGAAFLLLETKSVVQFALLFGTTWFVNALVFTGVLLSVYLAIEVSLRVRVKRVRLLYGALFAALAVAYLTPLHDLLALAPVPRFVAATLLAFTPIFIANLVFAQRFRDVAKSTAAFGANVLGAVVGGLIEYLALVTGYRALLLVVAAFYFGALVIHERQRRRGELGSEIEGDTEAVPAAD